MKKKLLIRGSFFPILSIFLIIPLNLSAQVKISEEEWTIPTYKVIRADKNPMFFRGESYQGASKYIYPYAMNDVISNDKSDQKWKALILENEYIKLCVTPEIGGKLYYGTDKSNGYNFIYKNGVVKPSNIGMFGAWVSGGIEWCVIHHHRASTMLPVDYDLKENEDGSKTIWIGESEPRHDMRWTIGITAYPGNFTHWPLSTEVYNGTDFSGGVDISWWKNSLTQNSYFAYDLKEDFMGGYDHGKETGTVHIGDHNIVKGAKLWEWGSGEAGQATEARLTDGSGPYVEIMVGAFSDNQPDYSWIRPYEVKTFRQYWFPVKDIEGFKYANLNGAVNLEKRGDNTVFLGYYSTQKIPKVKILLKRKGQIILEKVSEISPEKTFIETVKIIGPFDITDISTEMINTENNETLLAYQPVQIKKSEKLPDIVKQPLPPSEISTTEELYLTGSRILQFYNPTLNAMDYFAVALKRDPYDIRTNTAVGNIHLRNGEYNIARSYFSKAIKRLTKDFTRPSACEPLYLQGLTLKAMGLYDEAIDTLYRASWDYAWHSAAYIELARISCLKGDLIKALSEINESLSTNAENNSAINLKTSVLRNIDRISDAKVIISTVLKKDPLDFRAGNENYLLLKKSESQEIVQKVLSDLNRKMRDFDQNYLELAIGYMNDGLFTEAEDVLKRFQGKNQEISYYLGYLQDKKGNKSEAAKYFKEASTQSVDYGFPYRLETENVLKLASKYNPGDASPYYYMGNLLYDKQALRAIENWEKAVNLDPYLAIAWRNLGWGYYQFSHDIPKAIKAYEKAIELKSDDPVYYAELDPLYELNNSPIAKRASLFKGKDEIASKRDDSFVREIIVMNLSGQSDKAVQYLNISNFHFREGSSRVRDITVDAHLLHGKKLFVEKKYDLALEQFLNVAEPIAKKTSEDDRSPQIDYYTGLAYEALGKKSNARSYFTRSAHQSAAGINFVRYYQGLSLLKLGDKVKAAEYFKQLITEGDKRINQTTEVDFFAKFGEREAGNVKLSNAYLLKGLGNKGLGNMDAKTENLKKSLELSASNLYAAIELE